MLSNRPTQKSISFQTLTHIETNCHWFRISAYINHHKKTKDTTWCLRIAYSDPSSYYQGLLKTILKRSMEIKKIQQLNPKNVKKFTN